MPDGALIDQVSSCLVDGGYDSRLRPALELAAPISPAGLRSPFRVEEAAVACVGVALLAAANLAERRFGRVPSPSLHPGHVGAAVVSERHFTIDGKPAGPGFAPLSRFWRTSDGWARTHANYPWHRTALLETLGVDADPDEVAAAMRDLTSVEVEERLVTAGGVAAAVRSTDEWAAHPQGQALSFEPLIGHQLVPGAPPRSIGEGRLPAEGIRVLDLTRVIAGPVCTRYLGALGADVLRIDPPQLPDMAEGLPADTLLAKRSARVDLASRSGIGALHELIDRAHVVVSGYRLGSLRRFGLDPDQLAETHPGLVVVQLSAWGHSGPWAHRRGFDSIVQAATGIALGEGAKSGEPGALPCQLLDHGTGYLATAAALDGLRRQSLQGGTHVRTVSLARTAMWLLGQGATDHRDEGIEPVSTAGDWFVELGGLPHVSVVAPPGALDGQPLRWPGRPATYMQDSASWA